MTLSDNPPVFLLRSGCDGDEAVGGIFSCVDNAKSACLPNVVWKLGRDNNWDGYDPGDGPYKLWYEIIRMELDKAQSI
jgi:hypothetical protein